MGEERMTYESWKRSRVRRIDIHLDKVIKEIMKKKKIKRYVRATEELAKQLEGLL